MRSLLALLLAGATVTCGWMPADEQVLRLFFERSRIYDTTRLAPIASVTFNPRVEGIVERFEILARDDKPLEDGRLRRQARLSATVWSAAGRRSERTLVVTLERDAAGGWKVTDFRWPT